jgi:hypothetical protein
MEQTAPDVASTTAFGACSFVTGIEAWIRRFAGEMSHLAGRMESRPCLAFARHSALSHPNGSELLTELFRKLVR